MTYQDRLNQHLAEYKRTTLGIREKGVFLYRGKKHRYDHILPAPSAWFNLLEGFRRPMQAFFEANPRIKRHRYFHHLNSSQAFAFNLFFPYFESGPVGASVLLRAVGQQATFRSWEPESIPVAEEETNVDVVWETDDGMKTFCEVKLSETEFGTAIDDAKHRRKLDTIYAPALTTHVAREFLARKSFFSAYQILRNVWQLTRSPKTTLMFLMPRANTKLWDQLERVLAQLSIRTVSRIAVVAIEDVISALRADDSCPQPLQGYAQQLRLKYVLPEVD